VSGLLSMAICTGMAVLVPARLWAHSVLLPELLENARGSRSKVSDVDLIYNA
jgi:hypothetical protein